MTSAESFRLVPWLPSCSDCAEACLASRKVRCDVTENSGDPNPRLICPASPLLLPTSHLLSVRAPMVIGVKLVQPLLRASTHELAICQSRLLESYTNHSIHFASASVTIDGCARASCGHLWFAKQGVDTGDGQGESAAPASFQFSKYSLPFPSFLHALIRARRVSQTSQTSA